MSFAVNRSVDVVCESIGRQSFMSERDPAMKCLVGFLGVLVGACSEGQYCDGALSCDDAGVRQDASVAASVGQQSADASLGDNAGVSTEDTVELGEVTGDPGSVNPEAAPGAVTESLDSGVGFPSTVGLDGGDAAMSTKGAEGATGASQSTLPVTDAGSGGASETFGAECGDGLLDKSERCDDGNVKNEDGCSLDCIIESGYACDEPNSACHEVVCGDGLRDEGEACDDENGEDGDGCSDECAVESGFACPEVGQQCVDIRACGNGNVEGDEECDLGADNDDQGDCTSLCRQPRCGDGIQQSGEQCDDGDLSGVYGKCDEGCVDAPRCGDGQVQASVEECDLGSGNDGTGACAEDCTLTHFCGNGVVESDLGEQCEGDVSPVGGQPGCADCQRECGGTEIVCDGKCIDPASDGMHCGASADCQEDNAGAICGRHCVNSVCADTWVDPKQLAGYISYRPQLSFMDDDQALIVWDQDDPEDGMQLHMAVYNVTSGTWSESDSEPFQGQELDGVPLFTSAASGGRGYVVWCGDLAGSTNHGTWLATRDSQGWSKVDLERSSSAPGIGVGARGELAALGYISSGSTGQTATMKAQGGVWGAFVNSPNQPLSSGINRGYISPTGVSWFHSGKVSALVELDDGTYTSRSPNALLAITAAESDVCFGLAGETGLMVWFEEEDDEVTYFSAQSTGGAFDSKEFMPVPPSEYYRNAIELVGGSENAAALLWGVYDGPTSAEPDTLKVGSLWISHYDGEWGEPEQIVDMTDGVIFNSTNSDIAMNDAGQIIVAWATGDETWMRYYDGAQWEDPQQFDRPLPGATVSVAISPNGTALAATGDPAVWVSVLR